MDPPGSPGKPPRRRAGRPLLRRLARRFGPDTLRAVKSSGDVPVTEDENGGAVDAGRTEKLVMVAALGVIERGLLILVALMTLAATSVEILSIVERRSVNLGDILLMFLYTEVIAMVAVFYTGKGLPFVYPIFIAITALARLIVLQGKDMDPQNIVLEASAILLLAIAAVVLLRFARR